MNYQEELDFAKGIARKAGEVMLKYFGREDISHYKGDKTIVTLADEEINQYLIDEVARAYPEHGVFGEEQSAGSDRKVLWVCDPVDGTAMFARKVPVAVFSLALVVDGEPVVGVVYDPHTDQMYEAMKGRGAFCNGQLIRVNQQHLGDMSAVSNCDSSPRYVEAEYQKLLAPANELLDRSSYLVSIGSIIHAGCLVADGSFVAEVTSVSVGKNMDVAAIKVIVEEAGGRVTNLFGEGQRYDRDIQGAIISNGVVHDEIVRVIRENHAKI
jgi:fructose-1,6-bisphosphatase/inositol monophosphatase family enzyme